MEMPKKGIVVLILILMIAFGSSLLIAQEENEGEKATQEKSDGEMCVPLGIITLHPPESVNASRSPVDFPHAAHFAHYDCKTCHHKWEGATAVQGCTASGCHDLDKTPELTPGKKIDRNLMAKYYKNAFHGQCIDCHKKLLIKNKEMENAVTAGITKPEIVVPGPTSCIKCHPK